MSKVFRRPMFRRGGNVGDGIMTGIRDNFENGTPSPSERINKALEEYNTPAIDPIYQLLIQGGLRGMSETGGGSTLGNLAKAFEEPTDALFKSLQSRKDTGREIALAGVTADIDADLQQQKIDTEAKLAQDKLAFEAAKGDLDRQNKINVEIKKGENKLAELQFKVDNPGASEFRTDQVRPAFENVVTKRAEAFAQSKNPAVKQNPTLTAQNYTRFTREATPEIKSKFKGFKPYTRDQKGNIIEDPSFKGEPGEIIYDPISMDFLVFDNTGNTYILNPLTFEIDEN